MTLTLGKKKCREGLNVCMNDEFNLLHHGSSQKSACGGGSGGGDGGGVRRGRQYPFGPNGPRSKNRIPLGGHHSIFGGGGWSFCIGQII